MAYEHKRTNEVHHFSTIDDESITVTTLDAMEITPHSVKGGGSVVAEGNCVISKRGLCWDTIPNPNILRSTYQQSGQGVGSFLVNVTGLHENTTYYMKAYAICNDEVYYGND